ncbi:MAG: hypothetical protein HUU54_02220 [Ignavibacteriaceae bacterium]|nr:hypothetical protein [Ignavibacteriaceae bacterium]
MVLLFAGCDNPFAPRLDFSEDSGNSPLADQTTIDGVFRNLQYAYTFKDTSIYSGILAPEFIFTYRDYDQGLDISWGKDEEMKVTYGLFSNTERLDLIWNNIVFSSEDSSYSTIIRGFNLTITFNPNDIFRLDGKVNITLRRDLTSQKWQITKWIDESNF